MQVVVLRSLNCQMNLLYLSDMVHWRDQMICDRFSAVEYFSDISWDTVSSICIKDAIDLFGCKDAQQSSDIDGFFWLSVQEQDR